MRRFRLIAWVLLAVLLVDWTPGLPPLPVEVASAQTPNVTVIGPAGTLYYSTASVIVSNTQAQTNLFSIVIPAAMYATQAAANTTSTMTAGQPTLGPLNSSIPLHLQMAGVLDTISSPGVINAAVNFGVGTQAAGASAPATITLLNALTPGASQVSQPVIFDVYLSPIATGNMTSLAAAGNATPNTVNTVFMQARIELLTVAGPTGQGTAGANSATASIYNAATVAAVNTASAHILNVLWNFGTLGNYLRIYKVILRQGI